MLFAKEEHLRKLCPEKVAPAKDTNPNRWENGTQSYEHFLRKYLLQLPYILEAKSHVGIT